MVPLSAEAEASGSSLHDTPVACSELIKVALFLCLLPPHTAGYVQKRVLISR
jgi:hypothetical protein